MKKPILAALLSLLSFVLPAQVVPALVNYQGHLANPDGSPLATGNYELTFKVYTVASGLLPVWGPQIFDGATGTGHGALIPVVQGNFNVILGPTDINGNSLAAAFNGTNRYIEVTVSNHAPIAPRQQILTAPFAFLAANAGAAGLASNVVSGITINSASITGAAISGGTINGGTTISGGNINGATINNPNVSGGTINGATITNSSIVGSTTVPAASLTGNIATARLPADAALLDGAQTFTGPNAFTSYVGFGTNNPSAAVHAFSTGFPSMLVDGSANAGTWLALRNTAAGTNWHIISTGTGNGEGPDKLLFDPGPNPGLVTSSVLTLTPGGNVGIGTSSPASSLHIVGANYSQLQLQNSASAHQWQIFAESGDNVLKFYDANDADYFYINSTGAFFSTSDRRLKKDIAPLSSVLERALKLEPVSYRLKAGSESSPKSIGFIAQDVEPLFPEVVSESDGRKGLAYGQMVTVAIGAVQELNQKVDAENARLRDELKQQAAENADLRARLEKLEQLVSPKAQASR